MDTRAALGCVRVLQMPSTPRRTHFGSLLKKQNIKCRLGVILNQADTSRLRTTYGENIAVSDGDIRLDRHIIWL